MAEKGGLAVSGGNGYIDPLKAIGKLKQHGRGLWAMQAVVAFVMSVIAVVTGEATYSSSYSAMRVRTAVAANMQPFWVLCVLLSETCTL